MHVRPVPRHESTELVDNYGERVAIWRNEDGYQGIRCTVLG